MPAYTFRGGFPGETEQDFAELEGFVGEHPASRKRRVKLFAHEEGTPGRTRWGGDTAAGWKAGASAQRADRRENGASGAAWPPGAGRGSACWWWVRPKTTGLACAGRIEGQAPNLMRRGISLTAIRRPGKPEKKSRRGLSGLAATTWWRHRPPETGRHAVAAARLPRQPRGRAAHASVRGVRSLCYIHGWRLRVRGTPSRGLSVFVGTRFTPRAEQLVAVRASRRAGCAKLRAGHLRHPAASSKLENGTVLRVIIGPRPRWSHTETFEEAVRE